MFVDCCWLFVMLVLVVLVFWCLVFGVWCLVFGVLVFGVKLLVLCLFSV